MDVMEGTEMVVVMGVTEEVDMEEVEDMAVVMVL